ncbi:MAG: DNA polymerase III subunit gamma/tau [Aldersonia sp.]|nr:DNA polymerase III subunit gamma/tau [Aldersonia sp.]
MPEAPPSHSESEPRSAPLPEPTPEPQPTPAPEPTAAAAEPPHPVESEPPRPGEPDAAAVRAVWSELLAKVRERSRTVEVMLSGATIAAVTGGAVVLRHESGPLAKRLVEPRNAEVIRDALRDLFGVEWDIRCETGAANVAAPGRAPQRPAPNPSGAPKFSRPSRAKSEEQRQMRPPPPEESPRNDARVPSDEIPLPPEPADEPPPPPDEPAGPPPASTPDEEAEMLAEAARSMPVADRRDPDEVALELLQNELGARRIDG